MTWQLKTIKNIKTKNCVLIEGLPGIGNVGKVAVDFLIEGIKAVKIYELSSHSLPHSVFINEHNLIEMPKLEVFHKKIANKDFLFLAGDVQPQDEKSCYSFCEEILKLAKKHHCNDIITVGGIGLMEIPKTPKVFFTGNTQKAVDKYKDKALQSSLYGVVGPIVGVSGLLLGMADKKVNGIALLAETYGHPMYLGVKGAKEILKYFKKKFKFKITIEKLDKEIKAMEEELLKKTEELANVSKQTASQKLKSLQEVNYIG